MAAARLTVAVAGGLADALADAVARGTRGVAGAPVASWLRQSIKSR